MKKILAVVLAATAAMTAFSGCTAADSATLNIYNWGEYISNGEDGTLDVIAEFEKKYPDIRVNYTTFDQNESMYAKVKSGGGKYDVIIPSDYMINRMIKEDMLEKLDFSNIPNARNVMDQFKDGSWGYDKTGEYSVPYTWGTVGIIYNSKYVTKPVDSWDILWDADYAGKILMFDNPRDAFGIAQKKLGYSQNTSDEGEIRACTEELKRQKKVVQAYVMDQVFDKMVSGEAYIAPYYAGDAVTMMEDNPDLRFVIPKEGSNKFVDAMAVLKGSKHKREAELFINFMCEKKIARANLETICYSTPMANVKAELPKAMKNNSIIYPSAEELNRCEAFEHLPNETIRLLDLLWMEVKASKAS